jgi:CheY-like chemotaxis protein
MTDDNYQPVSILLVEDDDVDAMGIQRAFKKMRFANPIHRASDGIEGLALLRSDKIEKPYLVLLDLNMPRMGGLEMLQEIRKDPLLNDAIVFVLTTSKDDEDRLRAYQSHVAGYIVKSKLDSDFTQLLQFLDHYWRLVEMPSRGG